MIFLALGTQLPFDRLTRAVDEWCDSRGRNDIIGQICNPGPDGYRPRNYRWVASMDPEEFDRSVVDADFVIAHAGMGSIITALTHRKPIVILPRRGDLGEHRNNHQIATAERFRDRPGIYVAMTEDELPGILDSLVAEGGAQVTGAAPSPFADDGLITALRSFIQDGTG